MYFFRAKDEQIRLFPRKEIVYRGCTRFAVCGKNMISLLSMADVVGCSNAAVVVVVMLTGEEHHVENEKVPKVEKVILGAAVRAAMADAQ